MFKQESRPFRPSFGIELQGGGASLEGLEIRRLRELVAAHGMVLIRGHRLTVESLHAFTSVLFDRRLVYGGVRLAVTDDDAIQTAELGHHALGLHSEMAYTPLRPDLLVFACLVPARRGGETLVGDGCAVREALSPATRDRLSEERVRYRNVIRRPAWERMFGTTDPERVAEALSGIPDCRVDFDGEGTLTASHLQHAFVESRRGLAYADSLHRFPALEPEEFVYGLKKTWVEFENGPMPTQVQAEVHELCAAHAHEVGWRPGDVALVDNWSVMHGRTGFDDPERRILTSFGYADWLRPRTDLPY